MCPPIVTNGSWHCSSQRPLPSCSLFCSPGLVPLQTSQVDCESYRQDNATVFRCVPAAAVILGGLNNDSQPVASVEVFGNARSDKVFTDLNPRQGSTVDLYNGSLMTCGGLYKRDCSSPDPASQTKTWSTLSQMTESREGASSSSMEGDLQIWGGNTLRNRNVLFT